MAFSVLFVCSGNVCRSPAADLLLCSRLAPDASVEVSSAGLHAMVGQPMDRDTAAGLRSLGLEPAGHVARQFEPWMAQASDLILTAECAQRDAIVGEVPRAYRSSFTLREFARLALLADNWGDVGVIAEVAATRQRSPRVPQQLLDTQDSYGGGPAATEAMLRAVSALIDALVPALGFARSGDVASSGPQVSM